MGLRERLRSGDVVLGSWINSGSGVIAEIMASAGFDFLAVDAEHSAVDLPQTQALFQAMQAGNPDCVCMARLPGNRYEETKRYLDAGAGGVIVPLVNSRSDVDAIVEAVKYPPLGRRGVGFGRSHGYGFAFDEYMARANADTVICVQIEHADAVTNIDAILSHEQVDAALIGPYDLSASMGITAQFSHPEYVRAVDRIREACAKHGKAPGIHVVQPEPDAVIKRIQEGFRLVAFSLDITMVGTVCRNGLAAIRRETGDVSQPQGDGTGSGQAAQ